MKKISRYFFGILLFNLLFPFSAKLQVRKIDIGNVAQWQFYNRELQSISKDSVAIKPADGDGLMILKDETFGDATIEVDIRGENNMGRSFVGIAFNVQNEKNYEAIYFRPFNFLNPDTMRRSRAVQYVFAPNYPWEKLREEHPGIYENRVKPVPDPDKWFHARIVIRHPEIKVYVNGSSEPSLTVTSLSSVKSGKIALWLGNGSRGSFSNLTVSAETSQKVSYGNNPKAGKYFDVGDAKLYYEVYGHGEPVVLLHGGVYGYIDEFEYFINDLSQKFEVICIATRGHGKSEIGKSPFTWMQRADDAYKVIRQVTKDSVIVLGFSDGGASAYKLAAVHPELVKKLIVIGSGDRPKGGQQKKAAYTPEMLMGQAKDFFEQRKALMPEPDRWRECLSKLNDLYNNDYISSETFGKIKCPVLIMTGDRDDYNPVEAFVRAHRMIKNSSLSVIPACGHVVFYCNYPALKESIIPFLFN